jgi:hypothetical protein
MNRVRFAIRKVKDGKVKIFGKFFSPSEQWLKYDGRLDNQKFAFGLYYGAKSDREGYVCLWGTEKEYKSHSVGKEWSNEIYMVDNSLPWLWWNEVE